MQCKNDINPTITINNNNTFLSHKSGIIYLFYFVGDLPVALQVLKNMSSINVFIIPKRSGIYYILDNQLNDTREIIFSLPLPKNTLNLSFSYCDAPILNTELSTYFIGI